MITLKGAEVSAKIKEQVLAMNGKLGGYVPTAAIVRIGERPDDLSYERNVMKRIAAYGMETKSYVYPADITEEEFFAEFQKINDDEAIDGILLFRPLPKYINEKSCGADDPAGEGPRRNLCSEYGEGVCRREGRFCSVYG